MKLSLRLAGLCASATFILAGFPGLFQRLSPLNPDALDTLSGMDLLEPLLFSVAGMVLAGLIGFQIGNILSHPAGHRMKKPPSRPSRKVVHLGKPEDTPATEEASEASELEISLSENPALEEAPTEASKEAKES
jgi:hypothetical protein